MLTLMAGEDQFEPRLGRMRARGKGRRARKFASRVIAAANLARGGKAAGRRSGFSGSRIGRGAGTGRVLATRDRYAAYRRRRVIVKARTILLKGKGFDGAKAHLRYVERDGTTREGERGRLYGPDDDRIDRAAWLEQAREDRHQFRFIVSPEDGGDYEDLKPLARRLMARAEEDLGSRLDWVAVDHFNTGHPHTHIILRGKDDSGRDLIIARDYLSHGLRERACELVDLDLGPRSDRAIEDRLRAEVEQERLTSIDRQLLSDAARDILVTSDGRNAFEQTIRMGRLRKLEQLGFAKSVGAQHWQLRAGMEDALRRMGERGDIIRTMQRAYSERAIAPAHADRIIFDPSSGQGIVGRLVERGLADEYRDRHYLIVEATDGRSHYVDIGRAALEPLSAGAIVRVEPVVPATRPADRTIAAVAAANGGRYTVDAHLRFDPSASEEFAETHVRRLEAMRRVGGAVEREADGSWVIAADHLDRAAAYEVTRAKDNPVRVEVVSPEPLEKLLAMDAATWLDRELVASEPAPVRDGGFGGETRAALASRRQWLLTEGLAFEEAGKIRYRPAMLARLQRRELLGIAATLEAETGKRFVEAATGERIEGRLKGAVDLVSGRHALVERAREFSLVPWRPVLERHLGKPVSGVMRERGVSWTIGRQRGGPGLS